MTIRGLFTHFHDNTKVLVYENEGHQQKDIRSWQGIISGLKDGSRNTYAYCKVKDWYVNSSDILIIILKE